MTTPHRPTAPEVWDDSIPPGGYVCAVPGPLPDGICGMPVESEPCPDHTPATGTHVCADIPPPDPAPAGWVPWEQRDWTELDDPPACPACDCPVTRWDGISPDYAGDWWQCRHDHRFLLDHDGRTWQEPR
ncbi:hypothetical protein [Actinomadura kijaniata]|uniref:hypothetical protein n=1 Tax=Actinomadura kijaniata TaxID=46161 RepID=UPI0008363183|nr:hypothetical protein [Actinomadura kijaniata]